VLLGATASERVREMQHGERSAHQLTQVVVRMISILAHLDH
jgi:hypothetical protein